MAVCTNSASDGGKWDKPVDVRNRFERECDFFKLWDHGECSMFEDGKIIY